MSKLALLSAPAALGFAVGLLTGQTGPDSTVVAAVLPVVLSVIGGALLVFKASTTDDGVPPAAILTSTSVVLFSTFVVVGVYIALFMADRAAHTQILKNRLSFMEAVEFRRETLERCSANQFVVNGGRATLGLAPLPAEAFCDLTPLRYPPGRHPIGFRPEPPRDEPPDVEEGDAYP